MLGMMCGDLMSNSGSVLSIDWHYQWQASKQENRKVRCNSWMPRLLLQQIPSPLRYSVQECSFEFQVHIGYPTFLWQLKYCSILRVASPL